MVILTSKNSTFDILDGNIVILITQVRWGRCVCPGNLKGHNVALTCLMEKQSQASGRDPNVLFYTKLWPADVCIYNHSYRLPVMWAQLFALLVVVYALNKAILFWRSARGLRCVRLRIVLNFRAETQWYSGTFLDIGYCWIRTVSMGISCPGFLVLRKEGTLLSVTNTRVSWGCPKLV